MKQLIVITLVLLLFSCNNQSKEVYKTSIQEYVISDKEEAVYSRVAGHPPRLYFQNKRNTEACNVDQITFDKYQVGDTIRVLVKYWEKPKKKK
jgi:hypothetical protein